MKRPLLLLVLPLALAPGCGDDTPGGNTIDGGPPGGQDARTGDGGPLACIDGLDRIELSPADTELPLDGGEAAPVRFTATGWRGDGSSIPLDAGTLTWAATRADDTPPGTIAAGELAPYPLAGGTVTVTATDGCVTGTTTVRFTLEVAVDPPADTGEWDGTPVTEEPAPSVVYPSDQTRFPRNIYRTLFQWNAAGASEFRLTFAGAGSTVTVYTDGVHPDCAAAAGAACWEADETTWSFIAGSNAGGTVTFTVDALDRSTTPPTVRRGQRVTIGFSRRDVKGAIFYWSTTSAGIRRANIAAAVPEDYITGKPRTTYEDGEEVRCVACHVVSRDGRYLAAPVEAGNKSLWILEVTAEAPPPPLVKQVDNTGGHGFATISPDNQHVAVAWGEDMWLVDRATGAYIEDVPLGTTVATHPDWSPDGTRIVFATAKGDSPGGASIATIPFMGLGAWGEPQVLVPAEGDRTNLFPMYSPDGDWLAFSRGKGGHGDLQAQLFLVPAAGGEPVELVNANRVVSNAVTDGQHQNSLPTWAPSGDLYWVAFNSKRAYGVVRPAGTQQIWVAAIDPDALAQGGDPSFPAFRIPFQGLDEDNHRAYWTLDVRDPTPPPDAGVPPADAGPCIPGGMTCDPVDDVCCGSEYVCDTDDGVTYACRIAAVP